MSPQMITIPTAIEAVWSGATILMAVDQGVDTLTVNQVSWDAGQVTLRGVNGSGRPVQVTRPAGTGVLVDSPYGLAATGFHTAAALACALPAGSRLRDREGVEWDKQEDGTWASQNLPVPTSVGSDRMLERGPVFLMWIRR